MFIKIDWKIGFYKGKTMKQDKKIDYLIGLYKTERSHHIIFGELAAREKDKKLKKVLEGLASAEQKHAKMWAQIIEINDIRLPMGTSKFFIYTIMLIRKLFGLVLAVKTMEYFESQLDNKIFEIEKHKELKESERNIIREIIKDELKSEEPLKDQLVKYSTILKNIRDVIIGMNDGLVEVLAAVAGLGAALQTPLLTLIGGIIIALSGTLSMTGSAYLSTSYESHINAGKQKSASSSALYVGGAYVLGAIFPLIPFIFGIKGYLGIVAAIVLTAIVLSVVASLIAVISSISIKRNVLKTLTISIGSALITIALGAFARSVLHITI